MKVLRIIGLVLFKSILFLEIMCLLLSFSIKSFIKESVSFVFSNNNHVVEVFDSMGIEKDKVYVLIKNEEIQNFIIGYITTIFEGNVDVNNINIGEDILEFVNNNKDEIEKIVGETFSIEQIEDYVKSVEMKKINELYKTVVVDFSKEVPKKVKNTVSTFGYFLSAEFRLMIFRWCLYSLIVIALLQWSLYKWIKTFGNSIIWCGILLALGSVIGSICFTSMFSVMDVQFELSFIDSLYSSLAAIVSGSVCLIIYNIIKKLTEKRDEENEVSKIFV